MTTEDLLPGERFIATIHLHPRYFWAQHFGLFIMAFLTLGLVPYLVWKTTVLYVTNRRIVYRKGIIARDVMDLDLHKVNQVVARETIAGRLFGFGTLDVVENDGLGVSFGPVARPSLVRKIVQEQVYAA